MTDHFFEARGLYYRTNEWQEDRPTLVFLHGLSGSSSAWLRHEALFMETHNILSFDLRGHGKSKKYSREEDYTIPLFADDFYVLVRFLKINRFSLITHSFGVLIALEFFRLHQDMVVSSVLMSPSYNVGNNTLAKIIRPFFAGTRILGLLPASEAPGGHVDYTRHYHARDWDIAMTYDDVKNSGLRTYLYASKQAFYVKYEDLLPRITIPVLLIQGAQDGIFPPSNSEFMHAQIPNSERVLLQDADHIIVVNHFEKVAPLLVEFVNRTSERQ